MYHQVQYKNVLRSVQRWYICVLYGSKNKQRLFPYASWKEYFL